MFQRSYFLIVLPKFSNLHALSAMICETEFTVDWLVTVLAGNSKDLISWTASRIGVDQGALSTVILVEFDWKEPSVLPEKLVLKIVNNDNSLNRQLMVPGPSQKEMLSVIDKLLPSFHKAELSFYEHFGKLDGLKVPKIHYSQELLCPDSGIFVMEAISGGFLADFVDGLGLNQILTVTEQLALLHAKSLESSKWHGKFPKHSKSHMISIYNGMWEKSMRKLQELNADLDVLAKVKDWFSAEKLYDSVENSHYEIGIPPVIVHGDFWVNNILWQNHNGCASEQLLALIDWQMAHAGNCMEDLCCLMSATCSSTLRREQSEHILQFYHSKLTGYGTNEISLVQIQKAYQSMLPYSMAITIFILGYDCIADKLYKGQNLKEKLNVVLERMKNVICDILG